MAQIDLLNTLINQRKISENWYSPLQILDLMRNNKIDYNSKCIYNDLYKLSAFSLIEMKGIGFWKHKKEFRGKI
jgi:hypothetical protein